MSSSDYVPRNDGILDSLDDIQADYQWEWDLSYLVDDPDSGVLDRSSISLRQQMSFGCYRTKRCKGAE